MMNRRISYKLGYLAFLSLFILTSVSTSLHCQMAIWDTEHSGTIGGVRFEMSNMYEEENDLYEWDFSNETYFKYPLGKKELCVPYSASDNWHLTFERKIENLVLYIGVWRPGIYKFSAPFRLISHSSNIKKIDNFIIVERHPNSKDGKFGNGIITFGEPTCCLFLESSLQKASQQVMTFGDFEIPIFYCGNTEFDEEPPISLKVTRKDKIRCRKQALAYPKNEID